MGTASDQLLFTLAAAGVTLAICVAVIVVQIRKIRERVADLDLIKRSLLQIQREVAGVHAIDRAMVRTYETPGLGLHLRELKREQTRVLERLQALSSEIDTFGRLLRRRDKNARDHRDEVKAIVETSKSLQDWTSRMTAVYSEAAQLFESEPIRELIAAAPLNPSHAVPDAGESAQSENSNDKRLRTQRAS